MRIDPSLLPKGNRNLYHFELLLNPNDYKKSGAIIQSIYRAGTVENYDYDDRAPRFQTVSGEALSFVSHMMNTFGRLVPKREIKKRVKELEKKRYPNTGQAPETGVLGELFPRTDLIPGGNSTEIAVDVRDAPAAITSILEVIRKTKRAYPGLIGIRFVPRSHACLGFTRFSVSCTIELPAANARWIRALYRKVFSQLRRDKIFYSLHWGQKLDFRLAPLSYMYPKSQIEAFRRSRARLLDGSTLFSNRALERSGLLKD